jgi:hypothetical protein
MPAGSFWRSIRVRLQKLFVAPPRTFTKTDDGMVPFVYGGFWDVPRILIFWYGENLFLLSSYFDDDLDDYDPDYSIYVMPSWVGKSYAESGWQAIDQDAGKFIGKVQVRDVIFDSTMRQKLNPSFLDRHPVMARAETRQSS